MTLLLLHILLLLQLMTSYGVKVIQYTSGCKWANDGCERDEQCCSGRCFLAHPGTNPRCATTNMGGPCLFSFHCTQRMQCGSGHRCCAGNWGTCSRDADCCHVIHKCQRIKGFVYRKCRKRTNYLPKAGISTTSASGTALTVTVAFLSGRILLTV